MFAASVALFKQLMRLSIIDINDKTGVLVIYTKCSKNTRYLVPSALIDPHLQVVLVSQTQHLEVLGVSLSP